MARRSLLSNARVARLGKGIHNNIVISKFSLEDRKSQGMPTKRTMFFTFAEIDVETKKRKKEVELAWWKLDTTNDYFTTNFRNMLIQIDGILQLVYAEDEVDEIMNDLFESWEFKSVDDWENHKWKKKDVDAFMAAFKERIGAALEGKIGLGMDPFRLKLPLNFKGEDVEMPKYGVFVERADVPEDESTLKFSDTELENNNKSGNEVKAETAADSSTARL